MRISDSLAVKLLRATGKISDEQLRSLQEQSASQKKPVQDLAIKNGLVSDKDLTKLYAKEIDVPFVELNAHELKREMLRLIPERVARQYNAVLFGVSEDGSKQLAMEDPDDIQAINFLQKQLGTDLKIHVATKAN